MLPNKKTHKKIPAIHANAGVTASFRKQLEAMIDEMHRSVSYWVTAAYRANNPSTMAQDSSAAFILNQIIQKLTRKWNKKFSDKAKPIADYYAMVAKDRTDAAFKSALKKSGFTVEFKVTPEIQDILTASVNANVSAIKSISSDYLTEVQGIVMRSVQQGRDVGGLRKELEKRYGIERRKAALIARTSNNQASAMVERARAKECKITDAQWVHTSAGRHPRREHIDWHGKMYNIQQGMWSKVANKYVWPGSDFNCLPGDSIIEFATGCKKLFRRRYSGKLTHLITKSGKTIKATANHPILTQRGWIACHEINLGDNIIKIPHQIIDSLERDIKTVVPTISQIFDTTNQFIMTTTARTSGFEFHGDVTNEEVEIIDMDGFLSEEIDVMFCQHFCELFFPKAINIIPSRFLDSIGSFDFTIGRLFFSSESVLRGFYSILSLLRSSEFGADDICFRLTSEMQTCFDQTLANCGSSNFINLSKLKLRNTGLILGDYQIYGELFNFLSRGTKIIQTQTPSADMLSEICNRNRDSLSGHLHSTPFFDHFDSVIDKITVDFDGHVYNLENKLNWYSTQNYIIHNCRCQKFMFVSIDSDINEETKARAR